VCRLVHRQYLMFAEPASKFILLATDLATGCRFENEPREKINDETDADFLFAQEKQEGFGKRADFTNINT
jgi:hypothetical protein